MDRGAPDGVLMIQVAVTVENVPVVPLPANEVAVILPARLTTSSATYATVVTYTVPTDKTFVLSALEMASNDYTHSYFRVTIAGEVKFTDKQFQVSFNPTFAEVVLAPGSVILVEGKSDGVSAVVIDASIEGKLVG